MKRELVKISKRMSYVLRHHPDKIGIKLDTYGRVNLKEFIKKFNHHYGHPVSLPIIQKINRFSDKKRFAVADGTIRALYGWSVPVKPLSKPKIPPKILFHGTTHRAMNSILRTGIKKMNRDFVHLSTTLSMAHQVGARRDSKPVIFNVYARRAYYDGLTFYPTASGIWLVNYIPPKYIEIRNK